MTPTNSAPELSRTADVARAAAVLRAGRLVAFPTETVYGLGADATNAEAVRAIFRAKGRPATNPVIVHVADEQVAQRYARAWDERSRALAARFWPGPLTLVVPRAESIAAEVSAGRGTVGLRVPAHPLALELLRAFDGPVAAPSANRSNRISPTTAGHVRDELGESTAVILDGGPCVVGIESTVLDVSGARALVLRPGSVSREQIEAVIGTVGEGEHVVAPDVPAASPGQQAVHYAPTAEAVRFEQGQWESVADRLDRSGRGSDRLIVLPGAPGATAIAASGGGRGNGSILMPAEPAAYARRLYAALREADAGRPRRIWIEMPPATAEWAAVRDRLSRAARPWVDGRE